MLICIVCLGSPLAKGHVNMVLNVHRNRTAYKGRGEGGEGRGYRGGGGGEGGYITIATLSPPE